MVVDRKRGLALALVAGVAALSGCASTPAKHDWRAIEGPALVIYTDGNLESARSYYDDLERFRAAMRWYTSLTKTPVKAKTRIMLFKSSTDALPYLIKKEVGAWASVTATGNLAVTKLEGKEKQSDRQTLKRDLVKLWLDDARVRTPTWYKEGLAELVSAFVVGEDSVTVGGLPPIDLAKYPELIADAKKGHAAAALLSEEPVRYELEDRARVWLTVHYLMVANKERQADLRNYFHAWSQGTPSADAFKAAFGQDPAEFFRLEVSRYGTRQLPAHQFGLAGTVPEPNVREASRDEIEKLTAEVERAVGRLR